MDLVSQWRFFTADFQTSSLINETFLILWKVLVKYVFSMLLVPFISFTWHWILVVIAISVMSNG